MQDVGCTTYLSRIPTVRRRSAGGDPEGPGDSFRPSSSSRRRSLFDRPTRGRKMPHQPARAQAPASPPSWPRIIGPGRFLLSCILAFLKDGEWRPRTVAETGRSPMLSLTARTGQPMGKPPYPGVARPLLFSPERFRGRDARAGVSPTLREQVLSLIWSQSFVHYSEDAQSASVPGHLFLSPRPCSGSA